MSYHVRLLHKFDKLQTYIKENTKLDNIKYCENDTIRDICRFASDELEG